MQIMAVHQVPSLTQQKYEEVVRRLTNGKSRAESPSDFPFDGLLVHIAGQGPDGFWVVDVWESEEAARRFREQIGPIAQEVGIDDPPEFFPAHTFVSV
jgi:hypothetical protein